MAKKKRFSNPDVTHERRQIYDIECYGVHVTADIDEDGKITLKPKNNEKGFIFIDSDPEMVEEVAQCIMRAAEIGKLIEEGEEDV